MRNCKVAWVLFGVFIMVAGFLPCRAEGGHEDLSAGATWTAVIAAVAADYSSGAHAVASVDPKGGPRTIQTNLLPTISDITVRSYGRYFYRIERYNADNIAKFDIDNPSAPIWQYSTMGGDDFGSSNPLDMIFVSAKKAYVLRYGSTRAWVVNPGATDQSTFKKRTLDLSAYADSDGLPEMCSGVIANGKLFIVMQRLNRDKGYVPSNKPYVAVFDAKTNKEIDTGKGRNGLKGIPLPVKNPNAISYLRANNTIYVQGVGLYPGSGNPKYEYTGGIVTVNPDTYETKIIVNDGTAASHPYGAISGMAVVSQNKGYFVGYDGWGDSTLYSFNPTTGKERKKIDAVSNINIAGLESSGRPYDKNKMLWVSDATNGRIIVLNTVTDSVDEFIGTSLNPQKVVFVKH